ncbi:thioredoxin family protein [Candidatus Gribaldobacteria bacterium]|nr:thioredoxin family protein [Candidatus Gribaldobacteria bacterium]
MKKNIFLLFFGLILLGFFSFALKQATFDYNKQKNGETIFLFYSDSCHYCAKMKPFLEDLTKNNEKVSFVKIKITDKKGSQQLLEFYQKYDVKKDEFGSIPIVFIKDRYFFGYSENKIKEIIDYLAELALSETLSQESADQIQAIDGDVGLVKIPFLGEIDQTKYSLPALAVILGFFDGFNVCSLGALVLILGMVLVLKSRKKVFFFGLVYVLATALIYGGLILLWYKIFVFLAPFLQIMEILVGLLGVAGGVYFLQDFLEFRKKGAQCSSQKSSVVKRLSSSIQKVLQSEKKSILALGLSVLAFSVVITIVEFPCSAAVPLFFAGALAQAGLGIWRYILYIGLFVLFYMADEIIVFSLAVLTMTIKLSSQKFIVWITLIESIVLFLLGFYYLFGFILF